MSDMLDTHSTYGSVGYTEDPFSMDGVFIDAAPFTAVLGLKTDEWEIKIKDTDEWEKPEGTYKNVWRTL